MQEKAQDRQAELDVLRAKRAMEQNERQAREKERKESELRMKLNEELLEARKMQMGEKMERLQEQVQCIVNQQAKLERDEFQRIIQKQKNERENEIKLQQEKETLIKRHAEELRKQISLNEEQKKQGERDK